MNYVVLEKSTYKKQSSGKLKLSVASSVNTSSRHFYQSTHGTLSVLYKPLAKTRWHRSDTETKSFIFRLYDFGLSEQSTERLYWNLLYFLRWKMNKGFQDCASLLIVLIIVSDNKQNYRSQITKLLSAQ